MTADLTICKNKVTMNFRKVVAPKPEILPACKNCRFLGYDSDDRMNFKGQLTIRKVNVRCQLIAIHVQANTVCDAHEFYRADRSDR